MLRLKTVFYGLAFFFFFFGLLYEGRKFSHDFFLPSHTPKALCNLIPRRRELQSFCVLSISDPVKTAGDGKKVGHLPGLLHKCPVFLPIACTEP